MKKLTIILTVLLLLLAAAPAVAQTASNIADIETALTTALPNIAAYQAAYHAQHGSYQQVLWTHTNPPVTYTGPDKLNDHPTDQPATNADFWTGSTLPATTMYRLRCNTYTGNSGAGYTVVIDTSINGNNWQKIFNFGPDSDRARDWYILPPDDFIF